MPGIQCKCGCGQPAKTRGGYVDRACCLRFVARNNRKDRGTPPMCEECNVTPVKWSYPRGGWNRFCDKSCAGYAMNRKRSAEHKADNARRLAEYSKARRYNRVSEWIQQALNGREHLTAQEVEEWFYKIDILAYARGGNAARMARYQAAQRTA